jgi:hypothetical protein
METKLDKRLKDQVESGFNDMKRKKKKEESGCGHEILARLGWGLRSSMGRRARFTAIIITATLHNHITLWIVGQSINPICSFETCR